MTNEEFARKYARCEHCAGRVKCANPEERCCDYNLILDVAAKKDQQFKEYLEKKKAAMPYRSDWMGYHSAVCTKLIYEIINELFGE